MQLYILKVGDWNCFPYARLHSQSGLNRLNEKEKPTMLLMPILGKHFVSVNLKHPRWVDSTKILKDTVNVNCFSYILTINTGWELHFVIFFLQCNYSVFNCWMFSKLILYMHLKFYCFTFIEGCIQLLRELIGHHSLWNKDD